MQGVIMNVRDINIALISVIPDSEQQKVYSYLSDFCKENPLKPLSSDDILSELAESRECYERGEYEDFDDALDEISKKYGV